MHRDVGHVCAPDVVRPLDHHPRRNIRSTLFRLTGMPSISWFADLQNQRNSLELRRKVS